MSMNANRYGISGYNNMTGNLWLTSGNRIVLDDHSSESYCEPYDKIILTKAELSSGVKLSEFLKRIGDNR
jgi:hypothetical protein